MAFNSIKNQLDMHGPWLEEIDLWVHRHHYPYHNEYVPQTCYDSRGHVMVDGHTLVSSIGECVTTTSI